MTAAVAPDQPGPAGSSGHDAVAVGARGLRRCFGGRPVLDGLDLTVGLGEFVALLGASGSGKTTLLKILSGFDRDIEGDIVVARRRAVVFQEPRLRPWARVLPNVTIGLRDQRAKVKGLAALAEVGLSDHQRAWPLTLSGGEAQRVALARALVREPDLVMLDEPFGALDALTRVKMHALLQELCKRHHPAVLFVTHDVDEAIVLADRVLVLSEGRFRLDIPLDLPGPRLRTDLGFGRLRTTLLHELGIDDTAGRHTPQIKAGDDGGRHGV